MVTSKVTADGRQELRLGMLGCGFMGKCHTNAYRKIPYIYPAAGVKPRLLILCDQKARVGRARSRPLRLRRVLHRLARRGRGSPRRGVRQLRTGPGPRRALPCRSGKRQARDLRKADGRPRGRCSADARRGGGGARQGHVYLQLPLHARRPLGQGPDRRRQAGRDLSRAGSLPADGGTRPDAASGQSLGVGLAAFRFLAGHWQPRDRSVPVPDRRDQERFGAGPRVQPRAQPCPASAADPK